MITDKKGLTLIELMIAMVITLLVTGSIFSVFSSSQRGYTIQDVAVKAQQSLRVALSFMEYDLRMAGFAPNGGDFGIEEASPSKIRITADSLDSTLTTPDYNRVVNDFNSERITYTLINDELRQILYEGTGAETSRIILDNVTGLTFTYFDKDDNDLGNPVPADDLDEITSVGITLAISEPAGRANPVTRSLTTRVVCRNKSILITE